MRWKSGSPPHTRGKALSEMYSRLDAGITPAYAGKSPPPQCQTGLCRDHPRIRGEKPILRPPSLRPAGSPPHTRGKGDRVFAVDRGPGITPAYAGKSDSLPPFRRGGQDHPRIRGEKPSVFTFTKLLEGSPPHTRGKDKKR